MKKTKGNGGLSVSSQSEYFKEMNQQLLFSLEQCVSRDFPGVISEYE